LDWLFWSRKRRLNRDLLRAVSKGETQQVERLLDAGASANARNGRSTALSIAGRSHLGNGATVRLLLERGAFVNGDPKQKTENPLGLASHSSDDDRIRLLITHGADVNALQPGMGTGLTPLQELAKWAEIDTIALLLQDGAEVNKKSRINAKQMIGGFTALHTAASAGRPDVVRFLLDNGAESTQKDVQGRSALDFARGTLDSPLYRDPRHESGARALRETIALLEKEIERCQNH